MPKEASEEQPTRPGGRVLPDAIDLSKTQRPPNLSGNDRDHATASTSREALELSKLSAEREKIELEVAQMRDSALNSDDLRGKIKNEKERNELELQKLQNELGTATRSQYFEFAKAFLPAGTIVASIWVAANSINYQRDKDRSVEVSQQLVHFQNQITATQNQTTAPDLFKQRNAIAAIRSLRKDAVPSLLANLDLDHDISVLMALHGAILELNEDPPLQQLILSELGNSIKYSALRPNLPHLERYLTLWRDCLRQYARDDKKMLRQAASLGNQLFLDLKREMQSKNWDQKTLDAMTTAIKNLLPQR
jgi:hypothetical protein